MTHLERVVLLEMVKNEICKSTNNTVTVGGGKNQVDIHVAGTIYNGKKDCKVLVCKVDETTGKLWGKLKRGDLEQHERFIIACMKEDSTGTYYLEYMYILNKLEMGKLIELHSPLAYEDLISNIPSQRRYYHYSIPYFDMEECLEGNNLPREYVEEYNDFIGNINNMNCFV